MTGTTAAFSIRIIETGLFAHFSYFRRIPVVTKTVAGSFKITKKAVSGFPDIIKFYFL